MTSTNALCTLLGVLGAALLALAGEWLKARAARQATAAAGDATVAVAGISDDAKIREELWKEIHALRADVDALTAQVAELLRECTDLRTHKGRLEVTNEALVQRLRLAEDQRDRYATRCLALEVALEDHGGRPSQVHPSAPHGVPAPLGATALRTPTLPAVRTPPGLPAAPKDPRRKDP